MGMSTRTCAADDCKMRFEPYSIDQLYCSPQCGNRMRVRRCRSKKRYGGDDGGGGRQRRLFPKPALVKGKPPKHTPVATPNLFETDLLATFGGGVEYGSDGSVSDKNRYYVK
jgi:CGNR zinc finger